MHFLQKHPAFEGHFTKKSIQQVVDRDCIEVTLQAVGAGQYAVFFNAVVGRVAVSFHVKILHLKKKDDKTRVGNTGQGYAIVDYSDSLTGLIEEHKFRKLHSLDFNSVN